MLRRSATLAFLVLISSCGDNPAGPSTPLLQKIKAFFLITPYSAVDAGVGPGVARPNADAAAAAFDAAASGLGTLITETFEAAPLGSFSTLPLTAMTVTLNGMDAGAGIATVASVIQGYNTTVGGSRYLHFVPPFGAGVVTATFTPASPLQAWGAYFTGVGTIGGTTVELVFNDGDAQTFIIPGNEAGGVSFFGFTDPDKSITSVTVRETLAGDTQRDILGIDDVRYVPANETSRQVSGNETETVVVAIEHDGDGDGDPSPVVGVAIPPGTFNEAVTVTVRIVETTSTARCHDFLLAQLGKCIEVTATQNDNSQAADLLNDIIVGACFSAVSLPTNLPFEMYKFENAQGRATPLQQVDADFLNCDDVEVASAAPSNWIEGLAIAVSKRVGKLISPKLAYAADRGFGGKVLADDGLSFFTWASPIQLSGAVLAVDVQNSDVDGYAVSGILNLAPKPFEPFLNEAGFNPASINLTTPELVAANTVTVAFGNHVQTIPPTAFRKVLGRWVYTAPWGTKTGILSLIINPLDGKFVFAGATPTEGLGESPLATYRPFTVQIGHRIQGGGLECGVDTRYKCTLQH